jgi:hypothetical protein
MINNFLWYIMYNSPALILSHFWTQIKAYMHDHDDLNWFSAGIYYDSSLLYVEVCCNKGLLLQKIRKILVQMYVDPYILQLQDLYTHYLYIHNKYIGNHTRTLHETSRKNNPIISEKTSETLRITSLHAVWLKSNLDQLTSLGLQTSTSGNMPLYNNFNYNDLNQTGIHAKLQ